MNYSEYDKSEFYEQEIAPLVHEIRCLCNEKKIPYFFSFGVKPNENGKYDIPGGMISSVLLPETLGVPTKDPKFARMINVLNGFQTVIENHSDVDVDEFDALQKFAKK